MGEHQKVAELTADQKINLLAGKLIFALKYFKLTGPGLIAHGLNDPDATEIRMVPWTEDFCEALDQCGIHIDRDELDKVRKPPKRRRG